MGLYPIPTSIAIPILTHNIIPILEFTIKTSFQLSYYLLHSVYTLANSPSMESNVRDFYRELKKMDIEHDLLCAQTFLQQFQLNPELYQSWIDSLQSHIQQIHDVLWKCTEKIERHKQKWFVKYRSFDMSPELLELSDKQQILHKRFQWIETSLRLQQIQFHHSLLIASAPPMVQYPSLLIEDTPPPVAHNDSLISAKSQPE